MDKIEFKIKNILLKYGYIPDVKLKCNEVLDVLDTLGNDGPICDMLITIYMQLDQMFVYFCIKSEEFSSNGSLILSSIYMSIAVAVAYGGMTPIFIVAALLKCSWAIDWPSYTNQNIIKIYYHY